MILNFGIEHERHKVYKVYINDDPGLTLMYFQEQSNGPLWVYMGITVGNAINWK